jgi:hypothetical protein
MEGYAMDLRPLAHFMAIRWLTLVLLIEAYQETKLLAAAEIKQAAEDRKLLRDIEAWRTGNVRFPGFPRSTAQ